MQCDGWGTIPTEEHLADLRGWEGWVIDTFEVEGLTISDSDSSRGATRHFERAPGLGMEVRKGLKDSGDEQAR